MYFLCFNGRKVSPMQLGDPLLLRSAVKFSRSRPKPRARSPRPAADGATPKDASSGVTPSAPGLGDRAQDFGQLRPNFVALRKRRGSPSYSGDAFRPLKQRKYIAIDK